VSVFTDSSAAPTGPGRRYQQQPTRKSFRNSNANSHTNSISHGSAENGPSRRGFKPRLHPSSADAASQPSQSTSLYKFKLTRPNGRWQYKATPKPRINIRRQDGDGQSLDNATLAQQAPSFSTSVSSSSSTDQESSGTDHDPAADVGSEGNPADGSEPPVPAPSPAVVAETIKVSISTPADFKDVYYEIATIKSPYTFQVG